MLRRLTTHRLLSAMSNSHLEPLAACQPAVPPSPQIRLHSSRCPLSFRGADSAVSPAQERLPEGTQTHFRSIVTDQFCRVLGSGGSIYAVGDAATIQQVPQRTHPSHPPLAHRGPTHVSPAPSAHTVDMIKGHYQAP